MQEPIENVLNEKYFPRLLTVTQSLSFFFCYLSIERYGNLRLLMYFITRLLNCLINIFIWLLKACWQFLYIFPNLSIYFLFVGVSECYLRFLDGKLFYAESKKDTESEFLLIFSAPSLKPWLSSSSSYFIFLMVKLQWHTQINVFFHSSFKWLC